MNSRIHIPSVRSDGSSVLRERLPTDRVHIQTDVQTAEKLAALLSYVNDAETIDLFSALRDADLYQPFKVDWGFHPGQPITRK